MKVVIPQTRNFDTDGLLVYNTQSRYRYTGIYGKFFTVNNPWLLLRAIELQISKINIFLPSSCRYEMAAIKTFHRQQMELFPIWQHLPGELRRNFMEAP